jgi:RNA polymerase sigma-70 factor (ECF subfamily)
MDAERFVAALRGSDAEAARELVEAYGNRLFRSACLLCGNHADAEDLTQETFLQAIRSVERFRGDSNIYTWLHGILLNLTRHHHRKRKWLVFGENIANEESAEHQEGGHAMDMEAGALALAEALKKLSQAHREILVLRYYEQMKIGDIAGHVKISKGTAKSRLFYAVEELRKLVPAEMNLFGDGGTEEKMKVVRR